MLLAAWLVVVALGVLSTAGALLTNDDGVAIVTGVLGFLKFGVAAFGAFELTVVDGAGGTLQFVETEVALLMLTLSLLPGYVALTGPVQIIQRVRDTRMEEI
jgi:hypothetical protein